MNPLPADADCTALMLDCMTACLNEIRESMQYFAPRFDIISDYDDYIPAASRILTAMTDRFLAHIDATPRDALLAILDDADFIDDMMTADFSCDLFDILDPDYID
jgi:hypothetical protein